MTLATGDPASCSSLGGLLRTTAARLAPHGADPGEPHRHRVGEVAVLLDDAGALLQAHAQELAALAARASRLRTRAAARGLDLDELRARDPARAPGSTREAGRDLRQQADHVAARLGRSRAQLVRQLHQAGAALERLASETTLGGPSSAID